MVSVILANRAPRWSVMSALASVLCVAFLGAPPAHATAACSDVLVLGARGSGQAGAGTAADGGSGMGPQVYAAYQRLVSDLPERSVTGVAVDYPARGVESIALEPGAYFSGLERGVANVRGTLRRQGAACPNQRFVLMGYSQGAMVMHRAAQDLLASSSPNARSLARRIGGVILLADGDRRTGDRTTSLGSAAGGRGISYADPGVSGVRRARFPASWRPKVMSVCNDADVICDYSSLLQQNARGVGGVTVHMTTYTGTPDALKAADLIAARLR